MIFFFVFLILASGNVIGIDYGSELIKISVIKPGKKLVIVENEESNRMTFNGFAINSKESVFGTQAQNSLVKSPESSVKGVKQLLGKAYSDPFVKDFFNQTYSRVEIFGSVNGGVGFRILNRELIVEEVAGLVFQNLRKIVDGFSGTSIKDCVVTVPSIYTRSQKKALIAGLKISGLNLLGFVQENSAAILYYSIDRVDDDTDHVVLVWNIGSFYTQVSLFTLWGYKEKGKYLGFIQTLGHQVTENFGGHTIDYELSKIVIEEFGKNHNIDLNLYPKALAKISKEVNLAKKTLSANKKTEIVIESLVNEIGFKFELTREMVNSIVERHQNTILSAAETLLIRLNIDVNSIDAFELIGGITKVPKIQEMIENRFKKPAFHIHPFESVAHGAALLAAKSSATVSTSLFSFSDLYTCSIIASTGALDLEIFHNSQLPSKKSFKILIPDPPVLTLNENCFSKAPYYEYTFSESGLATITFTLDSKGFAFISSASLDVSPIKYTVKDISDPFPLTDTNIDEVVSKLEKIKEQEKQNEVLAKAKNDVESILYFFKDKIQEETFLEVLKESEKELVDEFIKEIEIWMDSEEFANVTEAAVREKVNSLREPFVEMLERENDYKSRGKIISDGEDYLMKLGQFMQMVNDTATWIPKGEVEEGWYVLRETEKWFRDRVEEQKTLKNWEKPALSAKECDKKFMFLRSQLEKFANYDPPNTEYKKNKK